MTIFWLCSTLDFYYLSTEDKWWFDPVVDRSRRLPKAPFSQAVTSRGRGYHPSFPKRFPTFWFSWEVWKADSFWVLLQITKSNSLLRKAGNWQHHIGTYLRKIRKTATEWQCTVWNIQENPKHKMPQAKKEPKTSFSCQSLGNGAVFVIGRRKTYIVIQTNAMNPIKWVHIFPVSEWSLKILLKQNPNDGMGGLWW